MSASDFRLLFVGDVVGRSGRDALEAHLPGLIEKHSPEFVIVNGENSAHGFGITAAICEQMFALGVGVITTGNHVWDQREIIGFIDSEPRLLRPLNYPKGTPGQGFRLAQGRTGKRVLVVNVMLRLFMDSLDDPFTAVDSILTRAPLDRAVDAVLVDVHGEATSEMMAMGHYLDGRVSAVIGTHTHVQTADERILAAGTGYLTDAGMTGSRDAVIGNQKAAALERFLTQLPVRLEAAKREPFLCGVLLTLNQETGRCEAIERIQEAS